MTAVEILKDEIRVRAAKLKKASPWDAAILAREIAERAEELGSLERSSPPQAQVVSTR